MNKKHLGEIITRMHKAPDVKFVYDECIEMYWISPYTQKEEKICMWMWPAHEPHLTKDAENQFEALMRFQAQAKDDIEMLLKEIDLLQHELAYKK